MGKKKKKRKRKPYEPVKKGQQVMALAPKKEAEFPENTVKTRFTANSASMIRNDILVFTQRHDTGAVAQAKRLANLPFVEDPILLMPNYSVGIGTPNGCVFMTKDAVVPNGMASDVGCGCLAIKTCLEYDSVKKEDWIEIMKRIRHVIPMGSKLHKQTVDCAVYPMQAFKEGAEFYSKWDKGCPEGYEYHYKNLNQPSKMHMLGTLGGSHHFIEFSRDTHGKVWLLIHAGAGWVGYRVTQTYRDIARKYNKMNYSIIPDKHNMAFLPMEIEIGHRYIHEAKYCEAFGEANRLTLEKMVTRIIYEVLKPGKVIKEKVIGSRHNTIDVANWDGSRKYIHRKSTTKVNAGFDAVVMTSAGSPSLVVSASTEISFLYNSVPSGTGRGIAKKDTHSKTKLENAANMVKDMEGIFNPYMEADLDGNVPETIKDSLLEYAPTAFYCLSNVCTSLNKFFKLSTMLRPFMTIRDLPRADRE